MITASKLAQLRKQNDISHLVCKSESKNVLSSENANISRTHFTNDQTRKFIIKFKPTKLEPFCQKLGKIPRISIETPVCEAAVFDDKNIALNKDTITLEDIEEDMSDEAFQLRHGKYENLERYTRISLLCLETSKLDKK